MLTSAEAAARLKQEGYNELPQARQRDLLVIAWELAREPMFLLLIAAASIYFVLGNLREAIFLLGSVLAILGITFYQERKTEHALEALRDLSSPRALVIRDGEELRISGREVVRGDALVLMEGDRVPADAVLLSCNDLSVDESLLTGESVPVRKVSGVSGMKLTRPGGDDLPFVYSGTLLIQGQGTAEVYATGTGTEIGKIGLALETVKPEKTRLHKEIAQVVRIFAAIALSLCVLVVILYGLTRDGWLNGFLAGIALAMSLIPEEFPVVLTVFLALGAWRISQKRVLTRRIPAIEALGSATVLCVDKTGTLTLNKMRVRKIFTSATSYDIEEDQNLPEACREILEYTILASEKDPFDPMERAFHDLGKKHLEGTAHLHGEWTLVHEYSLSPQLLSLSHVWKAPHRVDFVVAAKGAPEAIAELCHLWGEDLQLLQDRINQLAAQGLRVLGVARADYSHEVSTRRRDTRDDAIDATTRWPDSQKDFKFQFLGLVALADPIRPSVPEALRECYTAGIRVVMITGDYPRTAQAIAGQIGLEPHDRVITGTELAAMSDSELQDRIRNTNLFARVLPEQKLRLVNAFKANGEVVAMTGDGVNDAPALKAAEIGIAMGGRGTDVAREAASLVLLDDDFASIVHAIRLGRRIFDNLKKAVSFLLSVHVPIAGVALIPLIADWPLILFPVHILFLELIIDPACSIVFEAEPEETHIMRRPPRSPVEVLFGLRSTALSLLQGLGALAAVIAVFMVALRRGQGELDARALTFTTLVIANIGLIFINRSLSRSVFRTLLSPNKALWYVTGGGVAILALVLYVPFLRNLFHFSILHPIDLMICLVAGVASVLWFEVFKFFRGWIL